MIYPIVIYGSPMLRKVSEKIAKEYNNLDVLIKDMFETMEVSDGVGLAAPQIGKSIRLFVIDANPMAEDDPSLEGFKKAFINPKIIEQTGDKWGFSEGCLSLPEIREEVERPAKIRIQYYDEDFNFYDETYDGIKARIIQHEYDHLDGVLFVDHLSPLKKKLLKGKLNNIAKGKVAAAYSTKIIK
ncbi:MAG: peptide deformylase [Bacteroidales bacterium]|nr:peptide deformylase [Bacteroidales bacterium]MBN2817768.1 peptide deformylase [Bacteroidales bacterium]